MAWPKGKAKNPASGRKKGQQNKATANAKQAFALAFQNIGDEKALAEWALSNRGDFYKLYARLIPTEVSATVAASVIVVRPTDAPPPGGRDGG